MPDDKYKKINRKDIIKDLDLKVSKEYAIKDANLNVTKDIKIENPVTDLNIVLSKDQINEIIKGVFGPNGLNFDPRAMVSNYCCVDVSVGSSVAGPVSSVASSVSVPTPEKTLVDGIKVNTIKTQLKDQVNISKSNINVTVPKDMKVR
ncbi:hypothetical protein E9840_11835 [Tissierella creatinini]|nr:hypothetical protein E9840_11835 [Tissierella creatinini]TJX60377.1 hypothetical protein E8P77_20330 [Soehngenia saccharolytica]